MGYEGYSTAWPMAKMHPIVGNRGEFVFLLLLFPTILLLKKGRTSNEEGMRSAAGFANNKYAHLNTSGPSDF